MQYRELRERVVQGVIRIRPDNPPPLDRIRAVVDGSLFQVNAEVADAFAADDQRRELLRAAKTLTFTSGTATLSSDVLKAFIEDGTFVVGTAKYGFRPYPDFLRASDRRLGYWSLRGEIVDAKVPVTGAAFTGVADTTFICSPSVPAGENSTYEAPDEFIDEVINAMTQFIVGQMMEMAAATA